MNEPARFLSVDELRRAFDAAFAAPAIARADDLESFLRVRVGDRPLAFRVRELAGVASGRRIVPLATPLSEMLGLIGVRGAVVPVYDAAALLGEERGSSSPRWFALAAGDEPFALAFTELEGFLEAPPGDVRASASGHRSIPQAVQTSGELRGVIDVRSLLGAVRERVAKQHTTER